MQTLLCLDSNKGISLSEAKFYFFLFRKGDYNTGQFSHSLSRDIYIRILSAFHYQ